MTDEREASLPQGGTVEVSAAVLVGKEAVTAAKKREKDMTADEVKEYNRSAQKKTREKKAKKAEKESRECFSAVEVSKKDAKRILLDERQIQNDHVADTIVELAEVAARHYRIPFNAHLFTHGLRATLNAREAEEVIAPLAIPAEEVNGEILHRTDLYALWDVGFYRHEDTFDQWLADRRRLKFSAYEMSKLLGKMDFAETHKAWTSFAPRWNPIGLRPGYTQQQGLAWLDSQVSDTEGRKKRYLLIASRNSMKSTWVRVLALCLTVTYPDSRILIISETNKLSKKAMKEFRGYFEAVPNNPTKFQQYFAEYTIKPDDGKTLIYSNPLAHLGLPQDSVESSSMESSNTGSRFDFAIFDDPISRDNGTSNEEQREAALSKHGSIMKLREPAGFAINIQTPWAIDDLGDTMIKQNEKDPEHALAVRIDPVMTVLSHAEKTPLLQLTEQDVVLNFLPKLNWKFVRDEMRSPEGLDFFKTQYMCEFPPEEDEGLVVKFTEDEIRARIRPAGFFDVTPATVVMSLDRAFSVAKTADYSAICVGKIFQREHRTVCGILDVKLDRWKEATLVEQCVQTIQQYSPVALVVEQDKGYENLVETIRKNLLYRGIPVPRIITKPIPAGGRNANAKARRIGILQLPLADGRLYFASSAIWNDALIDQFVRFDPTIKSNKSRKDDIPDAVSLLWESFMPKVMSANDEPLPDQERIDREVEEQQRQEMMRQSHQRMFSEGSNYGVTTASQFGRSNEPQPESQAPRPLTPREQMMEQMMKILPPSMRRRG